MLDEEPAEVLWTSDEDASRAPPISGLSRHVLLERDFRVGPGATGGITRLIQSGNACGKLGWGAGRQEEPDRCCCRDLSAGETTLRRNVLLLFLDIFLTC